MKKIIFTVAACISILCSLTGCLQYNIHIEASALHVSYHGTGYPQATILFNISNLGDIEIRDVEMEIIFLKINEYELSKKRINETFQVNWSILPPGETRPAFFETSIDPAFAPAEALELWDNSAHWQITFKIKWREKRTQVTTQTFDWYV